MSNEHNNAPAVPQGEPVAAWLKAKIEKHALLAADCPGSSSVVLKSALLRFLDRLPPVAATPATAPAQERCSTCGYLTSEREHLGCLRRAVKDLDIATGGPYDAQGVGLTDEEIEIVEQTEELAAYLMHWRFGQEPESPSVKFRDTENVKAQKCWAAACRIQEMITATDVENAVAEVDDAQAPAPAQEIDKSVADAEIKAMYVESQGSEKGWLGIEGSYFIGGVVAARKQKAAPAPAQEPVAWLVSLPNEPELGEWFSEKDMGELGYTSKPLYTSPQEVGLTGPAVAWRMRDTGFRRPKYVYFDTKEQAVAHAAHLLQSRDDGHLTELTPLCEASTSTDLLDALRDNSWKLEPFEIPTGQGDADIGWRVVGFYMGKPKERTEATVYTDDPAAAIIAALRAKGQS